MAGACPSPASSSARAAWAAAPRMCFTWWALAFGWRKAAAAAWLAARAASPAAGEAASAAALYAAQALCRRAVVRGPPRAKASAASTASRGRGSAPWPSSKSGSTRRAHAAA